MTFRGVVQRTGISVIRRIAVLLVCVLVVSGCGGSAHAFAVQAVAAGVPSLAPFFDEKQGLGQDAVVRSLPVQGTLQQGDTPGLYGGTKKPTVCDVAKLKRFLTDPANHQKAVAWSGVLGITTDRDTGLSGSAHTRTPASRHSRTEPRLQKGKGHALQLPSPGGNRDSRRRAGGTRREVLVRKSAAALQGRRGTDFRQVRGRQQEVERI